MRRGYGAHTEKATRRRRRRGTSRKGRRASSRPTSCCCESGRRRRHVAHVTYLLEGGRAGAARLSAGGRRRARRSTRAASPELADQSFGAVVTFDLPGMAERAMYFGDTPLFNGGHASAGVTAPATSWFLAEGATGSYLHTFVLMANPDPTAADLTVTYLPERRDADREDVHAGGQPADDAEHRDRGSRAGERRGRDAGRVESADDRRTRAVLAARPPGTKRTTAPARRRRHDAGGWPKAASAAPTMRRPTSCSPTRAARPPISP